MRPFPVFYIRDLKVSRLLLDRLLNIKIVKAQDGVEERLPFGTVHACPGLNIAQWAVFELAGLHLIWLQLLEPVKERHLEGKSDPYRQHPDQKADHRVDSF